MQFAVSPQGFGSHLAMVAGSGYAGPKALAQQTNTAVRSTIQTTPTVSVVDRGGALKAPVQSPSPVLRTTPTAYLGEALSQQGLRTPPARFQQLWTIGGVKYEVRIHMGESAYGKTGPIFRVMRHIPNADANGQGKGREYLDNNGNWHLEKTLKPGPVENPNPKFNEKAAKDTHIDVPKPF